MDKLTASLIWINKVEEVKEGFIPRKEESFYWRPRNLRRFLWYKRADNEVSQQIATYMNTYCMPKGLIRYKEFIAAKMYRENPNKVVVVYKYNSPKISRRPKKKYYLPTKN